MTTQSLEDNYRLIEIQRQDKPALRMLIYHQHCRQFVESLARQFHIIDLTGSSLLQEDLASVEVLLTWKCPDEILDRLSSLRWIQTTSVGIDQILLFLRQHPGLIISTTKGMGAELVSNYVLTMMLACHWDLLGLYRRQQAHIWELRPVSRPSEKTCAVIGLGHIGRRVAEHAHHLGMQVLGTRRTPGPVPHVDRIFPLDKLDEMLAQADFVALTVALTEKTRGLIGHAQFEAMKPTAFLIQAARGGVVDEDALLLALREGQIAGAAVDVFEQEPLSEDHPLWEAPNIWIGPHHAGAVAEYASAVSEVLVHNVDAYPDLDRMLGVADTTLGY